MTLHEVSKARTLNKNLRDVSENRNLHIPRRENIIENIYIYI